MRRHPLSFIDLPDDRPPWVWADDVLGLKNSPFGKRFRSEHTPWIREPLEFLADPTYKEDTIIGCVQGAKTMFLISGACWAIRFKPGPMQINCQSDEDSKEFAKEKFNPTLESIPGIKERLPKDTSKRSTCYISLPDMFCLIQGANLNNLQSKSIMWQFNDEVFLWKKGLLDHARKRTTQYWNRKISNASTAGEVGDDLDRAHKSGDMREYHIYCYKCSQVFWPKWEVIKWPKQEDWDFRLLRKSTYLECPSCRHRYEHTEYNRKLMLSQARYIPTNPNPKPEHLSHRWNALVLSPDVLSWGDLAVEWIQAELEYQKGNDAPSREFIQKRLAESYDPNRFLTTTKLPTIEINTSGWAKESFRFLTVDVQEVEFWAVIRAWSRDGESRLMWAGKLLTYEEIEAKAAEFKVNPGCVFIDSSYDARRVYLECAKRNVVANIGGKQDWIGWKALNGEAEARKSFVYKRKDGKPVLLPYSFPAKYVDPMMGREAKDRKYAKLFFWSNIAVKDILIRLRDGKGAHWMAYDGVPDDWHTQMFSERRIRVYDRFGKESYKWERIGNRPNHLWDCECMQVVAACMASVIGSDNPSEEPDDQLTAAA